MDYNSIDAKYNNLEIECEHFKNRAESLENTLKSEREEMKRLKMNEEANHCVLEGLSMRVEEWREIANILQVEK